jgi:hypothetical protein
VDGDDVGRRVEELIATADEDAVRAFAAVVTSRLQTFADLVEQRRGRLVFCAGDSLLAWLPWTAAQELCRMATISRTGLAFSGGIGPGMTEALLALRLAKAKGRRCYVTWDDILQEESPREKVLRRSSGKVRREKNE